MNAFAGKAFVLRVDEVTTDLAETTFIADLTYLISQRVRPIVVAPSKTRAEALVRAINRSGNSAVGLSGADAAMLPGSGGGIGNVQTGILHTLTSNGYIPVVEPRAFSAFGSDVDVAPDEVAQAIATATDAVRALFFHALGGVPDPHTMQLISELTAAEALDIAEHHAIPQDLRTSIRAAALGVRSGVAAAQIVDGRVAHASIVELLTSTHLGTQVTGGVYAAAPDRFFNGG